MTRDCKNRFLARSRDVPLYLRNFLRKCAECIELWKNPTRMQASEEDRLPSRKRCHWKAKVSNRSWKRIWGWATKYTNAQLFFDYANGTRRTFVEELTRICEMFRVIGNTKMKRNTYRWRNKKSLMANPAHFLPFHTGHLRWMRFVVARAERARENKMLDKR